jgi:hypothetical protein
MKGITLKNNDSVEFEHRSNNIAFVLTGGMLGSLKGQRRRPEEGE